MSPQVPASEALDRLAAGNRRFVEELRSVTKLPTASHRVSLASGQNPFAAILSCSDSRVPSEMVFDQGLGDLFVVRVAGNVVAPSLVGSLEYAVEMLGVGLVVVMGHTGCGAVVATLDAIERGTSKGPENVLDIVERIRPGVLPVAMSEPDPKRRVALATRANVLASVQGLRESSKLLRDRLDSGELLIAGAEYSLTTGKVDFFDELAAPRSRQPSGTWATGPESRVA